MRITYCSGYSTIVSGFLCKGRRMTTAITVTPRELSASRARLSAASQKWWGHRRHMCRFDATSRAMTDRWAVRFPTRRAGGLRGPLPVALRVWGERRALPPYLGRGRRYPWLRHPLSGPGRGARRTHPRELEPCCGLPRMDRRHPHRYRKALWRSRSSHPRHWHHPRHRSVPGNNHGVRAIGRCWGSNHGVRAIGLGSHFKRGTVASRDSEGGKKCCEREVATHAPALARCERLPESERLVA